MKCRLCIIECCNEDAITVFNDEEESNLTKLIVKYLHLEITKHDEFPIKICFDCKRHLQEFHEFFEKVEQCQRKLTSGYVEKPKDMPCDKIEKNLTGFEHIEESLIDIKDEEMEIGNVLLTEAEEFGFADDKSDASSILSSIEPLVELYTQMNKKSKRSKKGMPSVQEGSSAEKKKRGRPRKKIKNEAEIADVANETDASPRMNEPKNKLSSEEGKEKDDFIAQNIELKCEICGELVLSFKKLRSHFRKNHNQKAYITCCGLHLTQRFRLFNHIRLHVDPDHFKCKYCEKMLTTQYGYEQHLAIYHGDQEDKKYECEVCQKRFNFKTSLKVHMNVHKQEANHQCEFCKKCFKTLNALQQHTEYVHTEKTPFVCHVCGKELKSKQNLQKHIADMHTGIPKLKCSLCDKWISKSYLKRHEEYHIQKEVACDECGKMFSSEGSLQAHKRGSSHKKRIFSCTYCEKTFKEKRFLMEHIAMHTGQKDYFCKYCRREFRCQSNMRKHLRKQHADEYAQEQAQKNTWKIN